MIVDMKINKTDVTMTAPPLLAIGSIQSELYSGAIRIRNIEMGNQQ
jgi:hypothetical protein